MSTLAINKKAKHDYEILETYEGGLVLTGAEVKAAKQGSVQLVGAFLSIRKGELVIKSMHIGKYKPAGDQEDYDPTRERKVLVHKKEINSLIGKKQAEGLTIVPIRVYTKAGKVKIEFAVARGKKKYEKRDSIKKRDTEKRMKEEMKKKRFAD